jgi:hypothetical protein
MSHTGASDDKLSRTNKFKLTAKTSFEIIIYWPNELTFSLDIPKRLGRHQIRQLKIELCKWPFLAEDDWLFLKPDKLRRYPWDQVGLAIDRVYSTRWDHGRMWELDTKSNS